MTLATGAVVPFLRQFILLSSLTSKVQESRKSLDSAAAAHDGYEK